MRPDRTKRTTTKLELVLGLSGLALFVLSFVDRWGSIVTSPARLGESGRIPSATGHFDAYYGYDWPLGLALVLGGLVGVLALTRSLARLRIPRFLYASLGLVTTGLVLRAMVRGPTVTGLGGIGGVEVTRGPLLFVALLLSGLVALAGLMFGRDRGRL